MQAYKWIEKAYRHRASDVHFSIDEHPKCRIDGTLRNLDRVVLSRQDCRELARELIGENGALIKKLKQHGSVDFARDVGKIRCRINVYSQRGSLAAAIRLLPEVIPALETLGLPSIVQRFWQIPKGLVLICGPTGSGKSTTLASILNQINQSKPVHIMTLEDPIEYLYPKGRAMIHQREIGSDVIDYRQGLRAALREDPDVLLIGEMRDAETVKIALEAAETGHLIFSTLHTPTADGAIDRMLSLFPDQNQAAQIRQVLSMNLKAVLWQQLLPNKNRTGRVCASEVLVATTAVQNLIRQNEKEQLYNFMMTESRFGSQTMEADLLRLWKDGAISDQTAVYFARDAKRMKETLKKS